MNSKTTWTYVAIAAALFAFIFFVEHPLRIRLNAARSTNIFPAFKSASVTRIAVSRSGEEILVARTNNAWTLTKPLVYPAAAAHIENLLHAIAELNWQTQITAGELKDHPKAQEEFGFASPTATSLTVQQGDVSLNLLVGTNTPVGEQVFVQVVGSPGIYVIDSEFLKFLPRTANDWRDTTLLRFSRPIDTIKSRSGNKSLTLIRTNGSWRMPQARADNSKVDELLQRTLALRVAKFETDDAKVELEALGLQPPEMELTFASGTNILEVLQIGKSPTNDPSVVLAKLQDQNYVFRVTNSPLREWSAPAGNFIDPHLVNLADKKVQRIEVRGENAFSLQLENGIWKIDVAPNIPVDSDLVRDVLGLLNSAEVEIEKDVVTDFSSYGLAPPALEYTLKTAGPNLKSVIAQIDFGTNQAGKVFVRRLDEYPDTVNSIHPEQYNRFPRASWQFRDRRIWNFSTNEVMSVTVQQKGKERKVVRNAKGDWSFAPGSQGIINTFALDEALYRLGELKAVFWVSPDEKDPAKFKIKEADHRLLLEVKRNGKTETLSLEFGGFSDYGTLYTAITVDGARMIFEFPWPLFFEVQDVLMVPSK